MRCLFLCWIKWLSEFAFCVLNYLINRGHYITVFLKAYLRFSPDFNQCPWSSQLPSVMVNFLCHLGWTMVPKYLVRHHSGCFWEGVFEWDWRLTEWTSGKADCLPYCEGALIQSVEDLDRTKDCSPAPFPFSPSKKEFYLQMACGFMLQRQLFCSLLVYPAELGFANLHDYVSQFIKIPLYTHTHTHTHTYTQTHRHGHMDTYTQTHTWAQTYRHTQTHRDVDTRTHTCWHTDTHTHTQTHTHTSPVGSVSLEPLTNIPSLDLV